MPIEIRQFSAEWLNAVREFNGRLNGASVTAGIRLPEDPQAEMLPGSQTWLALEEGAVRGGYTLRPQQFSFRGQNRPVAHYRLPVSEGLIDKKYALVGSLLLRSALQKEPLLYALGMGGYQHPLPRMLQAMGWSLSSIPFYFRVVHPTRFLRKIRAARQSRWRGALMDLAAATGAGWIGIHAAQRFRTSRGGRATCKEVADYGAWADEIWEASQGAYGMIGLRNAETLRQLYPQASPRFLRLRTGAVGWAVLLDTRMKDDQYFGDLRVGTIVDCLAKPEDAPSVIQAARMYLEQRGVDLIISNQGHPAWSEALRADGFFGGPSNFLFATSPKLSALGISECHLNRGDGDGPINL
ncbi:MAG TPA: hypothetical protein VG096_09420 [Bryobacteraceae bacterium]|jgi:hypothetical protein|nr:hypothetical protein [Bryobacteraceae bacterium]